MALYIRTHHLPICFNSQQKNVATSMVSWARAIMAIRRRLLGCFGKGEPAGVTPLQRQHTAKLRSLSLEDLARTLAASSLQPFTLAELKQATRNFSTSNFLGEGGFGPVYKGFVGRQQVAVKYLDSDGVQGHREWLAEVVYLGMLKHPHLVNLIGYCNQDDQRMLVYEYMPRGSLENHLFRNVLASLPWSTRLKIAVGAAKGLAFLHDEAETPVIYRDFKASNILLDLDYTAKLSDFGLAKAGPQGDATHVTTRVMGTHGYAAPEYILTGHLTIKSDVYSFGVVLLELLTGRRCVDRGRRGREQNLVDWARPYLRRPEKLHRIMDPGLELQYSAQGAQKAAVVAYQCLHGAPKSRPRMRDVVDALEPLLELEDDVPTGPFVYIVDGTEKESDANSGVDRRQQVNRGPAKRHFMSAVHVESMLSMVKGHNSSPSRNKDT